MMRLTLIMVLLLTITSGTTPAPKPSDVGKSKILSETERETLLDKIACGVPISQCAATKKRRRTNLRAILKQAVEGLRTTWPPTDSEDEWE